MPSLTTGTGLAASSLAVLLAQNCGNPTAEPDRLLRRHRHCLAIRGAIAEDSAVVILARPALVVLILISACTSSAAAPVTSGSPFVPDAGVPARATDAADAPGTLRLLFAGDIMFGRGIAAIVEHDAEGLFADVRFVVRQADVAVANLESPLTLRPHVRSEALALEADPAAARLLAAAGFDAVGIANNHAGDAGPQSVTDTIAAVEATGVAVLGGGRTHEDAWRSFIVDRAGVRIAYLSFDATGQGIVAGEDPGVAQWEASAVEAAVTAAAAEADVVVVGLHGGIEYSPAPDPQLTRLGELLSGWGADVVWGHGPHVIQPVSIVDRDGDPPSVVAPSLGNFLFDQGRADTVRGLLLEVVVDSTGVLAYRTGITDNTDGRVHFVAWELPAADAVLWDGEWWNLARPAQLDAGTSALSPPDFPHGDVIDASYGDLTGDGRDEVVVAYRHSFRANAVNELFPDHDFIDSAGRSAHLGVFRTVDLEPLWGAGTLFTPVGGVVACDGALAVAYTTLDDSNVTATGGWTWRGFGFAVAPSLPGTGEPGCADVDGDGRTEPVVTRNRG